MPYAITRYNAPARLPAAVERQMEQINHQALIQAHKIDAVRFVGRVAITAVGDLVSAEERVAQISPTAAVRAMAVGEAATATIAGLVLRMGFQL
ncbi:MAG: hypothetical protein ACYDA2_04225 [Acidimicrobiales bacterium]